MIVETLNFLELDFIFVLIIFKSSELSITSECEVYHAAEYWLSYNIKERRNFAKQLLLTVRLPLLPDVTLKHLINNSSTFPKIDECRKILNEVLNNKDNYYKNKSSVNYTSRYCNHESFNILVCRGAVESV